MPQLQLPRVKEVRDANTHKVKTFKLSRKKKR